MKLGNINIGTTAPAANQQILTAITNAKDMLTLETIEDASKIQLALKFIDTAIDLANQPAK